MDGEGLITIEIAVLVTGAVLAARLVSLLGARRALAEAEKSALSALDGPDPRRARTLIRRLSGQAPFGDWASDLLAAAAELPGTPRAEALRRAAEAARRRVRRLTSRAQALDLVVLAVTLGLGAFSREALRVGPLVLGIGAVIVASLLGSLVGRALLANHVLSILDRVEVKLTERPLLPTLGAVGERCYFCGRPATRRSATIEFDGRSSTVEVFGCRSCGKVVTDVAPDLLAADGDTSVTSPQS